jgi:toxin ParE1/3/4
MKRYFYHAEALDEYQQALSYHKDISQDLAERFFSSIEATISLIREQPGAMPLVSNTIRRAIVKGFPYSIFFSEYTDSIYILAIAHQRRSPYYWKKRTS